MAGYFFYFLFGGYIKHLYIRLRITIMNDDQFCYGDRIYEILDVKDHFAKLEVSVFYDEIDETVFNTVFVDKADLQKWVKDNKLNVYHYESFMGEYVEDWVTVPLDEWVVEFGRDYDVLAAYLDDQKQLEL